MHGFSSHLGYLTEEEEAGSCLPSVQLWNVRVLFTSGISDRRGGGGIIMHGVFHLALPVRHRGTVHPGIPSMRRKNAGRMSIVAQLENTGRVQEGIVGGSVATKEGGGIGSLILLKQNVNFSKLSRALNLMVPP
jgi:hypothetical protein